MSRKKLDRRLEVVDMEFGAMIPALIAGKVDMIVPASPSPTNGRRRCCSRRRTTPEASPRWSQAATEGAHALDATVASSCWAGVCRRVARR